MGTGAGTSAIRGAKIAITLAKTLQAPKTEELYIVGKYSAVTRKQRLKALETPSLVNIRQEMMTIFMLGGIKTRATPKTPPHKKETNRHFLVPNKVDNMPLRKHATSSAVLDTITIV